MQAFENDSTPNAARPRTVSVLALLTGIALMFSYLGAYAMADALVSAEMITPWERDQDPRPRWFVRTFAGMIIVLVLVGGAAQFFSRRQLQSIDSMDEPERF